MAIEKVREYFRELGIEDRVIEFDSSSATVELAAKALNVDGKLICKTLSFKGEDDTCILIQAAGDARIDNRKFKDAFHIKAKMLSADEVVSFTGHAIGGVCAFGIDNPKVKVYVDESVKRFTYVYPACGSSNSAIKLSIDELFKYSRALSFVDACKIPEE